jgi:hypothetical protein
MADGADDLRAGDADRQAIAERLRLALDEGRLDFHEYDDRLRDAYQARTYGELHRLVSDLPATVPPQLAAVALPGSPAPVVPSQTGTDAPVPAATRRWLIALWEDYFGAVAICVAIWGVIVLISDGVQGYWPAWVAGPWGVYLAYQSVHGLVTGEPQRWAVKQQRRQAAKELKRDRKREIGRTAEDPDAAEA